MANDYQLQVVDPNRPPTSMVMAIIPADVCLRAYKANEVKYQNLRAAKFVLQNPLLIFEGVREHQEGGWCYIARPAEFFIRPTIVVPLPAELVFAAYLNPARRLYEWRLEPAESPGSAYPSGHKSRYKRESWKNTS